MQILFKCNKAVIDDRLVVEQVIDRSSEPILASIFVYTESQESPSSRVAIRYAETPMTFDQFRDFVDDFIERRPDIIKSLTKSDVSNDLDLETA